MQNKKKINVLVIPDLFPKFPGDLQGIFLLDYLKCTAQYCNNTVLFIKLIGPVAGYQIRQTDTAVIHSYFLRCKKVLSLLKPLLYLILLRKGYMIGKKMKDVELIHAHGTILSGTLAFLLSKKLKVPFLITEHQGPFSVISNSFIKRNWAKFIMQRANNLLVVSEHLKNEILSCGIRPLSIQVSYNPVDTDLFNLKNNNTNNTMVFAGRLDNFKGAFRCLKAFHRLHQSFPEWLFVIAGDGEDMVLIKNYLNEFPELKQKVKLTGSLQKIEIAALFKGASFFVFPSLHESFGLVIAEALSCGVPVLTGNLTAPKEFVNESNGLLADPASIDDIEDKMRIMINQCYKYNTEKIRVEIVSRFSFDSFGKYLVTVYRTLINEYI